MSTTMWESEARNWATVRPSAPPGARSYPRLTLRTPGFVEIKPHTPSGIKAGLNQIARRLKGQTGTAVLATYAGTNKSGQTIPRGRASRVQVYATLVTVTPTNTPTVKQYSRPAQWYNLGQADLPPTIDHPPVDHAPAFGWAVESVVQQQVIKSVDLQTPAATRKWLPLGGPGAVADMQYTELAEFYRELAHELRDPFYAELAAELATLGSGGGALLRAS